jgi:glycosyltransferase involved in cell wall biosynthesis/CelD/BcsL family acetyltransferase involved in cellulose biosynthesis
MHETGIRLLKFITAFGIGGTERHVVGLSRALDAERFHLHLACLRCRGDFLRELSGLPVPIVEYPISRLYNSGAFAAQARFARYVRRHRIQMVHTYGFYPNVLAVPAARLEGGSIVVASIRDITDHLRPVQRRVQRSVCRLADAILVNAEGVRQRLVADGWDSERITVIRNGIDLRRFRERGSAPWIRRELGVPAGAPLVTVICRLTPLKGVEYFLEAAAKLAPRVPDARFLVVGDGTFLNGKSAQADPYRLSLMQEAARLGLGDRMIFTGMRLDVPEILSESTVSVLASIGLEGLSNAILESMAAGAPVVATRVGGNAEAVDDGVTGFVVPPRDPAAMAEALLRVLEDPDMGRRFGDAGRRQAVERFSMERMVRQTEDFYEELLSRPHLRRRLRERRDLPAEPATVARGGGSGRRRHADGRRDAAERPRTDTRVVDDPLEFEKLKYEWDELVEQSAAPCLFLTWEWLHTWWKHQAERRQLRIVTVRDGEQLIAIAPLCVKPARPSRLMPFRVLEFLGVGSVGSDYLDLIVRRGHEDVALSAVAAYLTDAGSLLEMVRVRPSASMSSALAERLGQRGWFVSQATSDVCPYIELTGQTWESYLATLGSGHRYNFRRQWRTVDKTHAAQLSAVASEPERQEALAALFDLHDRRWGSRTTAFSTAELRAFHEEFTRLALARGWLRLFVLRLDGQPAAALYGFRYGPTFYFYQSGFDPQFARLSVGLVTIGLTIRHAIEEGAAEYDLLHGDERYKFLWAHASRALARLELYPPGLRGALGRRAVGADRGAQRLARGLASWLPAARREADRPPEAS